MEFLIVYLIDLVVEFVFGRRSSDVFGLKKF